MFPVAHRLVIALAIPLAIPLLGLAVFATPALAQSENLEFTLSNRSSLTIAEFYAAPLAFEGWGESPLAGVLVEPGGSGIVTVAGGAAECVYKVRVVFTTGSEFVDPTVDLCTTGEYVLSDP